MAETKQSEMIPAFIKKAIESEVLKATQEELDEAQKRIEKRKTQIVAGVMLDVTRYMKMDVIGENITISIRIEDKK